MEENQKTEKRPRGSRCRNTRAAIVISNYLPVGDWEGGFSYYLQSARSLGLEERYQHPDIQALINFDPEMGRHSVLEAILNTIYEGAKYAPGDRLTLPAANPWDIEHTVEFRSIEDAYGKCLRAVVLGLEEEFQSLADKDVIPAMEKRGQLTDPFEKL